MISSRVSRSVGAGEEFGFLDGFGMMRNGRGISSVKGLIKDQGRRLRVGDADQASRKARGANDKQRWRGDPPALKYR